MSESAKPTRHTTTAFWELLRIPFLEYFRIFHCVKYRGLHHIPESGPVIFAPNHISYYDPPIVAVGIPYRIRFMAWSALFKVPGLGRIITALGAYPVNLKSADKASIERTLQILKNGEAVMIFPEGLRCYDGKLQHLEPGVPRLALQTGAAIVPVTITGAFHAWPRTKTLPAWFRPIRVAFHEPVRPPEVIDRTHMKTIMTDIRDRLYQRINRTLLAEERLQGRRALPAPRSASPETADSPAE